MENFNIALSLPQKDGFSVKVIDEHARIVSCSLSAVREGNKELEKVIFCYLPKEDLILLNEDNHNSALWALVLPEYMSLEDKEKGIFREMVRNGEEFKKVSGILESLSIADKICRIRRHRKAVRV